MRSENEKEKEENVYFSTACLCLEYIIKDLHDGLMLLKILVKLQVMSLVTLPLTFYCLKKMEIKCVEKQQGNALQLIM